MSEEMEDLTDRISEEMRDFVDKISSSIQSENGDSLGDVFDYFFMNVVSSSSDREEERSLIGVLDSLTKETGRVAKAITAGAGVGRDATGGGVESLTEAVMGLTAGSVQIATSLSEIASAIDRFVDIYERRKTQ